MSVESALPHNSSLATSMCINPHTMYVIALISGGCVKDTTISGGCVKDTTPEGVH